MKIEFDKAKWNQDSEGFWLALHVKSPAQAKQFVSTMKEKTYDADLKVHRNKRSLDANAYFWVLIGKLAATMHEPMDEIYRQYVKDIGDNFVIVPIRDDAKEQWIKNWSSRGIGWICEDLGKSKIDGYSNIVCYYGSSVYDTAQMSRLIDLVVQDCKDQDIETATPEQLAMIKEEWR